MFIGMAFFGVVVTLVPEPDLYGEHGHGHGHGHGGSGEQSGRKSKGRSKPAAKAAAAAGTAAADTATDAGHCRSASPVRSGGQQHRR